MTFDPHNPSPKPGYAPGASAQKPPSADSIFSLNRGQGPTHDQLIADVKRHYEKYYNSAFPQVTSTAHRLAAMEHLEELAQKHLRASGTYLSPADAKAILNNPVWGMKHEEGKLRAAGHYHEAQDIHHQVEFVKKYLEKNLDNHA